MNRKLVINLISERRNVEEKIVEEESSYPGGVYRHSCGSSYGVKKKPALHHVSKNAEGVYSTMIIHITR